MAKVRCASYAQAINGDLTAQYLDDLDGYQHALDREREIIACHEGTKHCGASYCNGDHTDPYPLTDEQRRLFGP